MTGITNHKAIRPIRIGGNGAYVPLTKGYEAIIDIDDVPSVGRVNWFAIVGKGKVYAARWDVQTKRTIYMHKQIMDIPSGFFGDHINGDALDNRKINLRIATPAQNAFNTGLTSRNTSGAKGVHWVKAEKKWQARISKDGRRMSLGYYDSLAAASKAYEDANKRIHGEFGRTK